MANGPTHASAFADQSPGSKFPPTVVEFQTIDVELVWIRFELADDLKERLHEKPAATTLSVCMVISWPRTSLVKHAAEFPDAAEKLRLVIKTFEDLRGREQVLGSRSRMEGGQFVGWLSYPNVVQAEAGFQRLQETLSAHNLRVSACEPETSGSPSNGWTVDHGWLAVGSNPGTSGLGTGSQGIRRCYWPFGGPSKCGPPHMSNSLCPGHSAHWPKVIMERCPMPRGSSLTSVHFPSAA